MGLLKCLVKPGRNTAPVSGLGAWGVAAAHRGEKSRRDSCDCDSKSSVLIDIQVHSVNRTRRSDTIRIEKLAIALARDLLVGRSQTDAFGRSALELGGDRTLGSLDCRRCHDEHHGNRHPRLNRRPPNCFHKRSHALGRVPRVVGMHRLEIVRAQHEYHEFQRGVDLNPLLKTHQPISPRFVRIVEGGPPTIQTILDHPNAIALPNQGVFHHARPAIFKRKALARVRNDPPRQRIRVYEDLLNT